MHFCERCGIQKEGNEIFYLFHPKEKIFEDELEIRFYKSERDLLCRDCCDEIQGFKRIKGNLYRRGKRLFKLNLEDKSQ